MVKKIRGSAEPQRHTAKSKGGGKSKRPIGGPAVNAVGAKKAGKAASGQGRLATRARTSRSTIREKGLPNVLMAQLQRRGRGVVIKWTVDRGAPYQEWSYVIDKVQLDAAALAIRQALQKLQNEFLVTQKEADRANHLRAVARAGSNLYELVMSSNTEFRLWFEANVSNAVPGEWAVEFQAGDVRPLVPWGLTFCKRPGTDFSRLGAEYADYVDFWCIRYGTVCYSAIHSDPESEKKVLDSSLFKFTIVTEPSYGGFEEITKSLGPGTKPESKTELKETLNQHREWHQLVYFYLDHQFTFNVSSGIKLSASEFADCVMKIQNSTGLAFIDREALIRGDRGNDWVDIFFVKNWQGFIATEVDISNDRLNCFGIEILAEIASHEMRLSELMPIIREKFWPWCLLYGVYCNTRAFYIKPRLSYGREIKELASNRFRIGPR